MSQSDLLKKIVGILSAQKIPFMLTGSLVSSIQGEPRSTHDIDIIISIRPSDIQGIVQAFPAEEFYLDQESIAQALKNQGMFNVIDLQEGDKVDFWMLTSDPFDQTRFSRRHAEELFGMHVMVSTPEDTILVKLHWCVLSGGSEKQFVDALRVYEVQKEKLDIAYIETWVEPLHVESLWSRVTDEAET